MVEKDSNHNVPNTHSAIILRFPLESQLDISITYHLQTNGQNERTIPTWKDMPRSGVINSGNGWVNQLPQSNPFTTITNTRYQGLHQLRALYGRSANHLLMGRNRKKPNSLVQNLFMKQLRKPYRSRTSYK